MSKTELKRKLEIVMNKCVTESGVRITDLEHISTWVFSEDNRGNKGELSIYGLSRYGYSNRQKFRKLEPITASQFVGLMDIKNEYNDLCSSDDLFEDTFDPMDLPCGDCGNSSEDCYCG